MRHFSLALDHDSVEIPLVKNLLNSFPRAEVASGSYGELWQREMEVRRAPSL